MPSIKQYIKQLSNNLNILYDTDEATSIAKYYVQDKLSLSNSDLFVLGDDCLSVDSLNNLRIDESRLLNGEPVQYITNVAWFCDHKFYVDRNVLIPRQETEILVHEILEICKNKNNLNILDIGTGSGCIPISLKKAIPDANVCALDISIEALDIAIKNARFNNVEIEFKQFDILSDEKLAFDQKFDIIISNPPYVRDSEKSLMHKNVTMFEPELALYVRDKDPLLFYRKILEAAKSSLNSDGQFWFEINEKYANEVIELCKSSGLENNVIVKDLNKKDRFIKSYF